MSDDRLNRIKAAVEQDESYIEDATVKVVTRGVDIPMHKWERQHGHVDDLTDVEKFELGLARKPMPNQVRDDSRLHNPPDDDGARLPKTAESHQREGLEMALEWAEKMSQAANHMVQWLEASPNDPHIDWYRNLAEGAYEAVRRVGERLT